MIGNSILLGGLIVAFITFILTYRHDSRAIIKEKEAALAAQIKMHTENSERLTVLMTFHEQQKTLNASRDLQVNELRMQTELLKQMTGTMNRRLELIENRSSAS